MVGDNNLYIAFRILCRLLEIRMADYEHIIVGAGLSGMSCAIELAKRGRSFKIFEASDAVGGRVRTDVINGFRLDRGFQVLLTAYPESKRVLDYDQLELQKFKSGALIRYGGEFCRVSDVVKHPFDLPGNLYSKAASLADKLKIASLRNEVGKLSISEIAESDNVTTRQRLQQFGFSEKIIKSFFKPFFGGVFLESDLSTSRRMFDFVFKMFAEGDVVLPRLGMGQISEQMASLLPAGSIQLNSPVQSVAADAVTLATGQTVTGDKIIVATDQNTARKIKGRDGVQSCGVTCLYFQAKKSPINEAILVLNGDETDGPINNICAPSDVSDAYAPAGSSLISVSVIGCSDDQQLEAKVLGQAKEWYGAQVDDWQHVRSYRIEHALPVQSCDDLSPVEQSQEPVDGVHFCGDYQNYASIHGAMASGGKLAAMLTA